MPPELLIDDNNFQQHLQPPSGQDMGLVPRDYAVQPYGSLYYAKPFDMPLIPRNEWKDRLQERIARKAQLSDLRLISGSGGGPIPSRDQNGKGYCVTADTEILTENGWVAYPDYDWTSPIATVNPLTHALEFQQPFERHVYEYDGPMIYSTNRRLDFGVTPDHQMYVRKWDEQRRTLSDRYSFVRAGAIGWYCGLLHAPVGQIGTELVEVEIPGDRRYDGDDFLALLALIVSDGFAAEYEHSGRLVSFASFRPELLETVRALAARIGFREQPSRPGVFNRWGASALYQWISENCYCRQQKGARAKMVPALVKCASQRQIKHFLHWFGDRSYGQQAAFWSTSKRLIDDLQELHLRIGKRSTIRLLDPKNVELNGKTIRGGVCYQLIVGEVDRLCLDRKKHLETSRYKGLVYCAAVPNHTLLTRRNGSVLISSNCWAHSGVSAHLLIRAFMGEPYADLSAYAIACMIKGFRDEGGWGGDGVQFQADKGCPTSAFWPQQSMSRANDNPKTWENAALHKYVEWMDGEQGNIDQLVTALLSDCAGIFDYNWWSHSVCGADLVDVDASGSVDSLQVRIWNSWGDSWSDKGMGILKGRKAIPDAMLFCRAVRPSAV